MYVLGINSYLHESSAAPIQDGKVILASGERFPPSRWMRVFPKLAIKRALDHAGIEFGDLDAIGPGTQRANDKLAVALA